ncbi:MAG TPA: flagellar type III secretion system pore protein FliP [Fimbriimonadaceae bacterium]|nr:flagellar type III secretion system pore protein FliP [Fimbriimonadaceae bacterium]
MKLHRALVLRLTLVFLLVAVAGFAVAQQGLPVPSVSLGVNQAKGQNDVASSLQILALLTVLSLAPAILILTTSFSRIVIIFSFLRSALGTPTIPPNQVVIGLSLFLTFFVMGPTYKQINDNALQPYMKKEITWDQAVDHAQKPLRAFMLKNTYDTDLKLFLNLRHETVQTADDVAFTTLVPAFIISELKTAFVIGFYIFVPFLIIDLIVASALMSMGMMMMPPTVVALPAKLLVFVLANGWGTLIAAIITGYR